MTCACGHHHAHHPRPDHTGTPMAMAMPMLGVTGRLICQDAAQMMTALDLLPEHISLSRAEPGCLHFDIWQDDDPLVWHLAELFADADAFAAHTARTRASAWGQASGGIRREFQPRDVTPRIRRETRHDLEAIDRLLHDAFGGEDEGQLVRRLRADGDLTLSLVADAGGTLIGHVALSPLEAAAPAYALAPVAVASKAQHRGVGAALIRQALDWADGVPVVVLGHPGYYASLGFKPADLDSPYAGLALQMIGDLPRGSAIRHAPAFTGL